MKKQTKYKKELKIVDVEKTFNGIKVLENINFSVKKGEFLSILGPSGCGKTTLLRILIGIESADKGTIFMDNKDITNFSPDKRKMGIVFQNYALFPNMSVLENVEYVLEEYPDMHLENTGLDMLCDGRNEWSKGQSNL